jgi:hypothetical protein
MQIANARFFFSIILFSIYSLLQSACICTRFAEHRKKKEEYIIYLEADFESISVDFEENKKKERRTKISRKKN